MIIVDQCN